MSSVEEVGGNRPAAACVLCAGIAVQDQVFHLDAFPNAGVKARARAFNDVPGGCAANAAIAVCRLGGHARLISPLGGPVGDDAIGDTILAGLGREHVDCSPCIRIDSAASPISAIIVDCKGERTIFNYRDERLSVARVADPEAALQGVSVLLVDNRFPELVLPLCEAARGRGVPIVLDADQPTRLTAEFLRLSTHIIFPADGLRATAGCDGLPSGLRRIAESSAAFLAVTDGANGVMWVASSGVRHLPAPAVEVVDTLAAGDVFHGAFALRLAEGADEVTALRFANAAAALKCTRFGGIAGAPPRGDVERFCC
jgi:sulfofructose kinase